MSMGAVVGEVKIKVSFDSGKAKPATKTLNRSIGGLTKSAKTLGRSFQQMGRTISISGFVLGIVGRRVMKTFTGIAESIMKVSKEATSLDKATAFLGDTLGALALSGMLTDETLTRVMGTFQEMMQIAMDSAGPWAIINDAIQQLKNSIAKGALPALTSLSDFLGGFDLTPFKEALSEATTTFLTPIIEKIKELLGDEDSGVIGIKEKLNAIGAIGGEFVAGVLEGFNQLMTTAAELIGDDEGGMRGIAFWAGEVAAKLLVFGPAAAVVGSVIGGIGSIIIVIAELASIIGGVGALTLLGVTALIIADWETWSSEVIPDLLNAISNLASEIGISDTAGIRKFLKGMGVGIQIIVRGIEAWIRAITTVIRKLKALHEARLRYGSGSGEAGTGAIGEEQHGGMIHRTGAYLLHRGERVVPRNEVNNNQKSIVNNFYITGDNPREIANQVRRVFMPL